MINIIFCFGETEYEWVKEEFRKTPKREPVQYQDAISILERQISEKPVRPELKPNLKLMASFKGETELIDIHKILYIEVSKRIVEIHVDGEKDSFKSYAQLYMLEELLGCFGFIRINRYSMISVKHVRGMSKTAVVLNSGNELPLGGAYKNNLFQYFPNNPDILAL